MHLLFDSIRLAIAIPAFLLFAILFTGNWLSIIALGISAMRSGNSRSTSFVLPFFGGFAGALAFVVVPVPNLAHLFWLPIVLEPVIVVWLLAVLLKALTRKSGRAGA